MMDYRKITNPGRVASISQSAARMGTLGAVVGGTISAVGNTYKVAKGEQNAADAIANVARETVGTGISTATAAATMAALGIGGVIGLAGFAVVATISKGLLDSVLYCEKNESTSDA
jgi:hypothetical protein